MQLLAAALLAASTLSAQSIEGTVINRLTGAPISGVEISFTSDPQHLKATADATSDAQGAFRVEGLKPGAYSPHAEKRGFIPSAAGLRPIQVVEGGQPVTLRIEMIPMGKLSGRVLDEDGKPVKGATLELLASFGGPTVTADANGNFSFEDIVPATYTLAARPPKSAKAFDRDGRRAAWVLTYSPGVTQRSAASRVTINPGAEIYGHEIKFASAPVQRISGVVLDQKGEPVSGADIQLEDPTRLTQQTYAQTNSAADGAFEFRDIPEGDWRLSASRAGMKAFQSVQIAGRDVERYELRLAPPFSIEGVLMLDAPAARPTAIMLAPAVGGSEIVTLRPAADGKFSAGGVYPGRYQVTPIPPGPQFYLASIKLGDQESVDGRVEFFSSSLPLTVTYRSDGGTVRGTVEECGSATVLLVSQDATLRARREYVRSSKCSSKSTYEFTAVRPGDYYVLALSPSDPAFTFMSTDLNQGHLNAAAHVTVRSNESTQVDLKVTR
jgi:hypothetical protein